MHKLIKSEKFKNKKGKECVKNYYGTDEDNISCTEIIEPIEEVAEEVEESITQEEINAEILMNQINIMAKQEEQDQVLAEILLSQTGGM